VCSHLARACRPADLRAAWRRPRHGARLTKSCPQRSSSSHRGRPEPMSRNGLAAVTRFRTATPIRARSWRLYQEMTRDRPSSRWGYRQRDISGYTARTNPLPCRSCRTRAAPIYPDPRGELNYGGKSPPILPLPVASNVRLAGHHNRGIQQRPGTGAPRAWLEGQKALDRDPGFPSPVGAWNSQDYRWRQYLSTPAASMSTMGCATSRMRSWLS